MTRATRYDLTFAEEDTRDRFKAAKRRAQSRMGKTELVNDEFLNLLLDVYQLHLHESSDETATQEAMA